VVSCEVKSLPPFSSGSLNNICLWPVVSYKVHIHRGYFRELFALVSGGISTLRRKPSIINRHKFKEMRQKGWVADVVKAREKLSFQTQYSLEEAMQETIDWYQRYNWL